MIGSPWQHPYGPKVTWPRALTHAGTLTAVFVTLVYCFLCIGCTGTSYKVAPSTEKVTTKIAVAKRTVQHAREQATELQTVTTDAAVNSKTTTEHIQAALTAITQGDYATAAAELNAGKASSELVQSMLQQSLRNIVSMRKSLETTEHDLGEAESEIRELKKTIEVMALQGAKDRAIVERGEWLFGFGYYIVGTQRLLTHALWGILILGVTGGLLALAAVIFGGPFAAVVWRMFSALWGLLPMKKL